MKYQKITSQDRLWIIALDPDQEDWDGIGYPYSNTVWACLLSNQKECENLEALFVELTTEKPILES